ncbi:MAG: hypothetical protein HYY52_04995 [Candidatus Melainabacteria bacterium]|nr:hypothetical protein [Candidatus Melainabacteria bacterium]
MNYNKMFFLLFLLATLSFSFLPLYAGEEEDNQCKDRCEANNLKKETGYSTLDGSCKDGFQVIESICCCEAK